MKLTFRQKLFCEYYVACGNATESAIKAGYSKRTARSIGQRLLQNVDIQNYIKELNEKNRTERMADMQEIKEFWTSTLRDKKAKMQDRIKASELLAKTEGAFLEKVEIKGEITNNNPFNNLTTEELRQLIKDEK